jgi:hypothetical protein
VKRKAKIIRTNGDGINQKTKNLIEKVAGYEYEIIE